MALGQVGADEVRGGLFRYWIWMGRCWIDRWGELGSGRVPHRQSDRGRWEVGCN